MDIKLDISNLQSFVYASDWQDIVQRVQKAHEDLAAGQGEGSEFTGWLDLPSKTEDSFLKELQSLGNKVRKNSDCLISLGIGGSYLGVRATIEFLIADQKLPVYYGGNN
ncbi:MAG: glucose-6-phosphate isomerase, partial [Candidatus Omnitrophica bacterium]|nr:glucose-6-phosphate isomerase [Candidatus Omnitrophota bacterium]